MPQYVTAHCPGCGDVLSFEVLVTGTSMGFTANPDDHGPMTVDAVRIEVKTEPAIHSCPDPSKDS